MVFLYAHIRYFLKRPKTTTSHSIVYYSHLSQKQISVCCGAIIDNISHAPICVLQKIYRKTKNALNNVLNIFFKEVSKWSLIKNLLQTKFHNI